MKDTYALLGNDIDSHRPKVDGLDNPRHIKRITYDLTKLYPLLTELQFKADLFVLNPPWRLWWYLDEQNTIECKEDLSLITQDEPTPEQPFPVAQTELVFREGEKYSIRTQTVLVKRTVEKPNPFDGRKELLEFSGQELAIIIADRIANLDDKKTTAREFCFMDAKLKADKNCEINVALRQRSRGDNEKLTAGDRQKVDFTLQQLAAHFIIPEVPDVAAVNPEIYAANLAKLTELEQLTDALCQPLSA
jgi:hypothetical protein